MRSFCANDGPGTFTVTPASAAVPEPATLSLVLLAGFALCLLRLCAPGSVRRESFFVRVKC
ncbi:MAG: PEP-CTERM sorting domain-containing protein [Bryobacteraceae bacterium]